MATAKKTAPAKPAAKKTTTKAPVKPVRATAAPKASATLRPIKAALNKTTLKLKDGAST